MKSVAKAKGELYCYITVIIDHTTKNDITSSNENNHNQTRLRLILITRSVNNVHDSQ